MLPHPQPYFMYFINLADSVKNQKPVAMATLSIVAAIALTVFDEDEYVFGRLGAGAKGYLHKDASIEKLVSAMAKAGKGKTILGSSIARLVSSLKKLASCLTVALRFVNRL